jgi:hypothetical protein
VTLSPNAGRVTEVDMAAEDSFIVLVLGLSCVARVARQKVGRASLVPVGHSLASAGQGCGDALHGSRAAVLRRSEETCFSSPSDDEVGGYRARSARSER